MRNFGRTFRCALVFAVVIAGPFLAAQQGVVNTAGTGTAGVHIESYATYPDVVIKTGDATNSGLRVFNGANSELLQVFANGNIRIGGTAIPQHKLEIFNGTSAGAVVLSTPLAATFPVNAPIGGLRMGWKYSGSGSNNVDLQVVRGLDAVDGAGLAVFTSTNPTTSFERMRITSAGLVGIGTTIPTSRLMVKNDVAGTWGLTVEQHSTISANGNVSDVASTNESHITIPAGVTNNGSALGTSGIVYLQGGGTLASSYGLLGWTTITSGTPSITNAYGVWAGVNRTTGTIQNGYGVYVNDVGATNDYGVYQAAVDDSNYFGGDVQVGPVLPPGTQLTTKLTVNGNVNVTGTITGASVIGATFQDVAEWVPATSDMEPGTVVVLNGERVNEVMPSHRAYDTSVAGVVSANPGIILGVGSAAKEQIATTGRVKVRVDATRAPVKIGDLLVTSDVPGTAMRSEPMELNGRHFHQPGTIIGKALQPLEGGRGEILVLLSLQ